MWIHYSQGISRPDQKNHVLRIFQNATRVELTSPQGGMMFLKVGATVEKAHLLGPIRRNSLVDGTHNMSFLLKLMGLINVIRERWSHK